MKIKQHMIIIRSLSQKVLFSFSLKPVRNKNKTLVNKIIKKWKKNDLKFYTRNFEQKNILFY